MDDDAVPVAMVSGGQAEAKVGGGQAEAKVGGGQAEAKVSDSQAEVKVGGGQAEAKVGGGAALLTIRPDPSPTRVITVSAVFHNPFSSKSMLDQTTNCWSWVDIKVAKGVTVQQIFDEYKGLAIHEDNLFKGRHSIKHMQCNKATIFQQDENGIKDRGSYNVQMRNDHDFFTNGSHLRFDVGPPFFRVNVHCHSNDDKDVEILVPPGTQVQDVVGRYHAQLDQLDRTGAVLTTVKKFKYVSMLDLEYKPPTHVINSDGRMYVLTSDN